MLTNLAQILQETKQNHQMFKILSLLISAAAVAASGGHVSASNSLNEDILEVVASDTSISAPRELVSLSTIADLASSNSGLTTLNTALKATGLDKTLKSAGPFTVFAPTDKVNFATTLSHHV
jgi:uncharacterized surface protein with fasciclin (FAS1) repeats